MPTAIRCRFAPSPTGPLHIGGVRTALYNYLFVKKHGGSMILRIEDTDRKRYVEGAEQYIMESLAWTGITFDEGPAEGGKYGPYRQSERNEIYSKYATDLVDKGFAYYAFDTPEELEEMRRRQEASGGSQSGYNQQERVRMNNSLVIPPDVLKERLDSGEPYVIRIKVPDNEKIRVYDEVREWVEVDTNTMDDKVLFKSDGMPTYHLANVVDDYLMEVSHVIRGEEWLPSLPLHVLLYRFLGWEGSMPKFAHLPLLLKPDGKGKLSKRDGDRLGFPVFPLQWKDPKSGEISSGYRESGYYPEAFVNILAFLGWNPGTEQELFSMDELTEAFSLDRVGKAGSRFDPEKARWFNHQYLIKKSDGELAREYMAILQEKGVDAGFGKVEAIVGLIKERADFVSDFWEQSFFFFHAPDRYDEKLVKKKWKESTGKILEELLPRLQALKDFRRDEIEKAVKGYIEEKETGMGQVMISLRICIVGSGMGPDLFRIMEVIGREETVGRVRKGIERIAG